MLLDNFPKDWQPRESQKKILNEIESAIKSGHKKIIISAPTGIGKSYIAKTLADSKKSSFIVTSTKQLQDQYVKDFPKIPTIKGMSNFACFQLMDFEKIENFDSDNLELALKFASVLYYWINSFTTPEILTFCNLKSSSYSAAIEEGISQDAHWALSTLHSITQSLEGEKGKIGEKIKQVAEFCRIGTSNEVIINLLTSGLEHMGRSTAIKLRNYSQMMKLEPYSLKKEEFMKLFSENEIGAQLLFDELQNADIT